jgi:hypothetical protein
MQKKNVHNVLKDPGGCFHLDGRHKWIKADDDVHLSSRMFLLQNVRINQELYIVSKTKKHFVHMVRKLPSMQ